MADNLGIMLTELPEATSIDDNDLMYIVQENNSEKVKVGALKDSFLGDAFEEGSGNIVSFADGIEAGLAKCIAEITPKQAGSGTPSPSNVRAISGYTAVNVNVSGKNKLPTTVNIIKSLNTGGTWTDNKYVVLGLTYEILTNDGVNVNGIKISGTATSQALFYLYDTNNESCPFIGDILSGCPAGGDSTTYDLRVSDVSSTSSMDYGSGVTISLTATGRWRCQIMVRNGVTMNGEVFYPMIRTATESAEYEPYKGSTTTTPLGQTVYGGQLNVLTGELKITHEYIDMGTLTWDAVSNQRFASSGLRSTVKIPSSTSTAFDGISEEFTAASNNDVYNHTSDSIIAVNSSGDLVLYYSGFISYTGAQVKTALDGIKTIYELATPQTVQLTPQEVNSLLGQNNISADTGDVDIVYVKASARIIPNPSGKSDAFLSSIELGGKNFEIVKELPAFPTSNGNYKLKLSISNGVPTLSWVSDT